MNKRSVMEYLKSYFDEDAQGRRNSKGRHQPTIVTDVAPYCFLFSSPSLPQPHNGDGTDYINPINFMMTSIIC